MKPFWNFPFILSLIALLGACSVTIPNARPPAPTFPLLSYSEVHAPRVAEIGRVPEKSRFRLGSGDAREHAAPMAGLDHDRARRRIVSLGQDCPTAAEVCRWEVDSSSAEVPGDLLHSSRWTSVPSGPWGF